MSTSVLVTGANGQLGQTIQQMFGQKKGDLIFTYVSKNELDITNNIQVSSFLNKHKFDYCINCAAYTIVEQAEQTPEMAYKVNAEGVKNIVECCKTNNTILIHISTDYVFDGEKTSPYTVHDTPNPINEYGKSKYLGEQLIQSILQKYFIIRTSWLYSTHGKNFLKTIVSKINNNERIKITTSQTGTPTSCIELSKFIYFIIKSQENNFGVYHFSALGETTWYNFAVQISKYFKEYSQVKISPTEKSISKIKRPKYSVLSTKKTLDMKVSIKNWEEALNESLDNLNNGGDY